MTSPHLPDDKANDFPSVLRDQHCRTLLAYFRGASEDVASVSDLARSIEAGPHLGAKQLAVRLHHANLPRLAETGVLEYDVRNKTVRYRGNCELLAASIAET